MSEDKSAGSTSELKLLDGDKPERPKEDEEVSSSKDVVQPLKQLGGRGEWNYKSRSSRVMRVQDNGKRKGRADSGGEDSDNTEANEGSEVDVEAKPPKKKVKSNKEKKDDEGTFAAEKEAQILKEVGTKKPDETLGKLSMKPWVSI